MRVRLVHPVLKIINSALIDLPVPVNISYLWNFGSLLGLCLAIQIITGVFLAMHYCPDVTLAFNSIHHILRDVNYGFILKYVHANGASMFFLCVYVHVARGLYYGSYLRKALWNVGVIILLIMMATAFVGYVLPWGQMSFWGATVITNFVSAVPYVGDTVVQWLWGGFSVNNATLNRFLSIHYLLPFILTAMVLLHLLFLHQEGSNTPTGLDASPDRVPFNSYFSTKDVYGFFLMFLLFSYLVFFQPNLLGDPENFQRANSLVTPVHIMPEWYFLFAYAILRAIPNKLGGVIALVLAVVILMVCPFVHSSYHKSNQFRPLSKISFWFFIANFLLLTWAGSKPVEAPYVILSQISALYYFLFFLLFIPLLGLLENYLLYTR